MSGIEDELASLIRNEGLSPRRLELFDCRWLFEEIGSTDVQHVFDTIVQAMDDMEQDIYTRSLRNAFGLGYSKADTLSERRADWKAELAREGTSTSENTLRRWERKALEVLARNLASNSKYHTGEPENRVRVIVHRPGPTGHRSPYAPEPPEEDEEVQTYDTEDMLELILKGLQQNSELLRKILEALKRD